MPDCCLDSTYHKVISWLADPDSLPEQEFGEAVTLITWNRWYLEFLTEEYGTLLDELIAEVDAYLSSQRQ
jgi:hypothetical protein